MKGIFHSYLNSASSLLEKYQGDQPFHNYIREFFRQHSKYGSRDRKKISHLCYCFFRSGHGFQNLEIPEKILLSLFICNEAPDPLLAYFKPELDESVTLDLPAKLALLEAQGSPLLIDAVFPLTDLLSPLVTEPNLFVLSHLRQPKLFLRIRPGRYDHVMKALERSGLPFHVMSDTVELPNSADVTPFLEVDKDVVVQDLSSQRTGKFIAHAFEKLSKSPSLWDCCAGSGGKSILAHDINAYADFLVSDIRTSILRNLRERFQRAEIYNFSSSIVDLTKPNLSKKKFDMIIADLPCSGSGTWGRTPADMHSFNSDELDRYVALQRSILWALPASLKPGGQFLFFTCSVFKEENEGNVDFIKENSSLVLEEMDLIKGYNDRADTLFASRFTLPA